MSWADAVFTERPGKIHRVRIVELAGRWRVQRLSDGMLHSPYASPYDATWPWTRDEARVAQYASESAAVNAARHDGMWVQP